MKRWSTASVFTPRWPVHVPQLSSDGHTVYQTTVWPGRVSCPCSGFGFRQRCRHSDDTKTQIRELQA